MVRSVEDWQQILAAEPNAEAAAKRILGDISHYKEGGVYEDDDIQELANALNAVVKLATRVVK